jgi:hypothetical protein
MHHFQLFRRITPLALLLALGACGGGSESSSVSDAPLAARSFCNGTIKELFSAMQGSYDGVADAAFSVGAGAPLMVGKVYPVRISGQDCSIRFTGDKNVQYRFIYGDVASPVPSKLTAFSATGIIKSPASLNLGEHQYNISITDAQTTIELERRVKMISGGDIRDGDLYLYSIPGPTSFGGLTISVASRR